MSDRIKVFVSSIQNKEAEDLLEERKAVIRAIETVKFTEVWAFEHAPAMPQPPEEVFLEGIANSDIFVLIIGKQLTPPVKKEYGYATDLQKRILIFPKNGAHKSSDVTTLLEEASSDCKYDSFKDAEDLEQKCARALENVIVKAVKHPTPAIPSKTFKLQQEIDKLITKHKPIKIHPLYPQNRTDDIFYIETANSQFIKLQKSSNMQAVSIPLSKIENIMHSSEESVLELNGRLQWTEPNQQWKYFPDGPQQQTALGVAKEVSRHYPELSNLAELFRSNNMDSYWATPALVSDLKSKGWEIFYDEDGCYLAAPESKHTTRHLVLVIKRGG